MKSYLIKIEISGDDEFILKYDNETEAESDVVKNIEEQIRDYGVLSLLDIKVEELEE